MKTFTLILGIVDILLAVSLVFLVLFQQGQDRGLGAIAGGAETFFGKSKGRSIDSLLKKLTTVVAVSFLLVTVVLYLLVGKPA